MAKKTIAKKAVKKVAAKKIPSKKVSAKKVVLVNKTEPQKKIFVLDTSVILFDHNAIKNFQEHNVAIPITVLEELDNFKKGNDTINFEAREFIRYLDKLSGQYTIQNWMPINGPKLGNFKVIMNEKPKSIDAQIVFGERKADHKIINAAIVMKEENPDCKVVLITKDVNLRLKAKSLNLLAEDYETGKIKNLEGLYSGNSIIEKVKSTIIDEIYAKGLI
ncbi:MAG: hypothetical protein JHD28_11445, partial [Bacteroidia bacterium]|nr:hypothetical protein [Bacteroidia bacterium]